MKPIIVFAAAFVVGTAGGTGAKIMLTKPPAAPKAAGPDSTHAANDSTHADSAATAEKVAQTPTDSTTHNAAPAADSSKPVAAPVVAAVNMKPSLPAPTPAAATPANDTTQQAAERRLAKVFTSMEAKQAAKVLANMTDGDVHVILGYVGPRQAATILAEMPPERVANLSKIAMQKPAGAK